LPILKSLLPLSRNCTKWIPFRFNFSWESLVVFLI